MTLALVLFWVPMALLAWVYAGYPAAAALAARLRPFAVKAGDPDPKLVTIGIAVHDEAGELEARVANAFAQAVPFDLDVIVASDGSTDDSIEILQRLAMAEPRLRFLDLPRGGQTAAQQAIFAEARGEIVVLTDAETRFADGCLASLVAPFRDPRVGCTTGLLVWLGTERSETARTEGAYWRYEQFVRGVESRAGWLTAVTGALLAVRSSGYRPVSGHLSMDQVLPLHARAQGKVVLAVHEAVASERVVEDSGEQLRNRARVATQGIRANLSMVRALAPWRRPSAALAIWSHKLLRWTTPWLVAVAGVAALWLGLNGQPAYLVPVLLGVVGLLLAAVGVAVRRRGGTPPRLVGLALTIVVVNVAFLVGWWNVITGRKIEAWHRAEWSTSR